MVTLSNPSYHHTVASLEVVADEGERGRFMVVLAVALAVLMVILAPAFRGELYVLDDIGAGAVPYMSWYSRTLAEGGDTTWCRDVFCGSYVHGEGQLGMYHPFIDVTFRLLPLHTAYWLTLVIRYPLLVIGMYLLLCRWQLPRDASLLGAVTFAYSGFSLLRFVHIGFINLVVNIPFLLWATDILLRDPSTRRARMAWLGVVLLTTSELLLGFPQAVYYSAQIELFYVLVLVACRQVGARQVAAWIAAKLLGLLGGAVQLVPTYEALTLSTRKDVTLEFILKEALKPADLLQLIAPYRFPNRCSFGDFCHEFGLYDGSVATVLSVWAVARLRRLGDARARVITAAALILSIYGLLVSLGHYGLLARLHAALPVVGNFRGPARYLLMVHLGMSVLVAVAFADLIRAARDPGRCEPLLIWLVAVAAMLSFARDILKAYFLPYANRPGLVASGLAGVLLLVASVVLVAAATRRIRFALPLLIVFSVADQAYYSLIYLHRAPTVTWEEYNRSIPLPPDGHSWRVEMLQWDNANMVRGLRSSGGYTSLEPRRRLDYTRPVARRLAGVGWVAGGTFNTFSDQRELTWIPSPNPLPFARLVGKTVTNDRPEEAVEQVDIETTAVVTEDLALPPGPPGSAVLEVDQSGHMIIGTASETDRLLVVAESFHPGWRVSVDGHPVRPLAVNGDFIGCVVPSGSHRVELVFRPWSLELGRWISVVTLASTFGIWLIGSRVALRRPFDRG